MAEPVAYNATPNVRFVPLEFAKSTRPKQEAHLIAAYQLLTDEKMRWSVTGLSDLRVRKTDSGYEFDFLRDFGNLVLVSTGEELDGSYPVHDYYFTEADGSRIDLRDRADAEDFSFDEKGGVWVSFERFSRIWSYQADRFRQGWLVNYRSALDITSLGALPFNQGVEGLSLVHDEKGQESLLLGIEAGGFWLCGLENKCCKSVPTTITPGLLYKVVSLEAIEGTDKILVLYRYYEPFTGPKSKLYVASLKEGKLVGEGLLLEQSSTALKANYEGVSAVKTKNGYRIFLISDTLKDNEWPKLLVYDWPQ